MPGRRGLEEGEEERGEEKRGKEMGSNEIINE